MWRLRVKAILFCGLLVALYNDWLLGPFLNHSLSTSVSMISELSAQTQPYHWVFQTLDISAGVLTLAALPLLWHFLHKQPINHWPVLFVAVAAIGADSIVDALLPITCAPSTDPTCNLATTHSLLTQAHMAESTLIGIVTFVTPLMWWLFNRSKQYFLSRPSLWFVLLQVFIGVGILLTRSLHYHVVGAFQRSYQLGIGVWIISIMYAILVTTSKRPSFKIRIRRKFKQVPLPTLALFYDE